MEQTNDKISRTIRLKERRTCIKMEGVFWDALKGICDNEKISIAKICSIVDQNKKDIALTSAIRIFAINYFINKSNAKNTTIKNILEDALSKITVKNK